MGRGLTRISVGGIQDESQIRGHRRTYVGAMPGRIVQAIRRCGTRNPVMVIDEIDKMGSGPQGDPSAALLEVLDPEQNKSFTDHYMDVAFDLSRVLFVTTANYPYDIPGPLMDRMEVVTLPGYTESEKVEIARRHLLPKALERTGTKGRVRIATSCVRAIIRRYTAEAGVRDLGRRLEEVCRKYAVRIASGKRGPFAATGRNVESILGRPPVTEPERREAPEVGVVTGLAWTPYGGDLLVIEAIRMPGDGSFSLTGSLGTVMKESVQAAASWVRAHAAWLGIPMEAFGNSDVHVHFPEGAVPKDGPSAGVAITVALSSVFTGLRVRHDVAMTGEVTLRGKVLPIGGLREKLTAAYRGGIREVFVPKDNVAELEDVPAEVRKALKVTGVASVEEVLKAAIISPKGGKNRRLGQPDRRQGSVPR